MISHWKCSCFISWNIRSEPGLNLVRTRSEPGLNRDLNRDLNTAPRGSLHRRGWGSSPLCPGLLSSSGSPTTDVDVSFPLGRDPWARPRTRPYRHTGGLGCWLFRVSVPSSWGHTSNTIDTHLVYTFLIDFTSTHFIPRMPQICHFRIHPFETSLNV